MAWPPATWELPAPGWRADLVDQADVTAGFVLEPAEWTRPPGALEGARSLGREVLETLVLTALIYFSIRAVVQNFRIEGHSMEPALQSGQYLLVNKLVYRCLGLLSDEACVSEPQRGDVIVFHAWDEHPRKDFIKRVIGLPGEELALREGRIFVNGEPLSESYLRQAPVDPSTNQTVVLGEQEYFVLGDNRANSSDSRVYGALKRDHIVGKAWLSYWPPEQAGVVPEVDFSFASAP